MPRRLQYKPKRRMRRKKPVRTKLEQLSKIVGSPDVKRAVYTFANLNTTTAGAFVNPAVPIQGVASTERVGNNIRVCGCELRYSVNGESQTESDLCRITLFKYTRVNNSTTPYAQGDLFLLTGGIDSVLSPLEPDMCNITWLANQKKAQSPSIVVYYDKTLRVDPVAFDATPEIQASTDRSNHPAYIYKKRFSDPWKVSFNSNTGTLASITDNWLFVNLVGSDTNSNFYGHVVLYYIDS